VRWFSRSNCLSRNASRVFQKALTFSEVRALKRELKQSGLQAERDTFVLYRIIGNDLCSKPITGQSRTNLQFILEHEEPLQNCQKRYLVNRIFDQDEEQKLVALLERFGAIYTVVPFDRTEYAKIGFDLQSLPEPDFLTGVTTDLLSVSERQRLMLSLYRLKANYVTHNNAAKNLALREGRGLAKWVLPFDGDCFFTKRGWHQFISDVQHKSYFKYFVVPMTRVSSNEDFLSEEVAPNLSDEPQLLFRKDAVESFDEDFSYGWRSKVELLQRLQVAGQWDHHEDDSWDLPRRDLSEVARQFGVAGWVARLSSALADEEDQQGADQRWTARTSAILSTLQELDASVGGATRQSLVSVRESVLDQEKRSTDPNVSHLIDRLEQTAKNALSRGPYSVIDKTTLPPSGCSQDYWHPAPYWWPNPDTADGLPYVRRDGERIPGTGLFEPESDKYDRSRLQRVFDDSFTLAMAWQLTGNPAFADHAAKIFRRFFIVEESRMNPHLLYSQVRAGHNGNFGYSSGIIEMKDLYFYLDAIRILERSGNVSQKEVEAFCSWLDAYLSWLLNSNQGRKERAAANNHGTCYDLQVAAIASFLGRKETLYETLARAQSRIASQFAADGSQPHELHRKATQHYCCFNLQSWINLSELAMRWNVNLWGGNLDRGVRWFVSLTQSSWPFPQIDAFDQDRLLPIWFAACDRIEELNSTGLPESPYEAKPLFYPHDGVRPFWNIGSFGSPHHASQLQGDGTTGRGP